MQPSSAPSTAFTRHIRCEPGHHAVVDADAVLYGASFSALIGDRADPRRSESTLWLAKSFGAGGFRELEFAGRRVQNST
jgi:hypothetical protein